MSPDLAIIILGVKQTNQSFIIKTLMSHIVKVIGT